MRATRLWDAAPDIGATSRGRTPKKRATILSRAPQSRRPPPRAPERGATSRYGPVVLPGRYARRFAALSRFRGVAMSLSLLKSTTAAASRATLFAPH